MASALLALLVASFAVIASINSQRVVGVCGSLMLVMLVLAPVQFVDTNSRYAELAGMIVLTLVAVARRGWRSKPLLPPLVLAYLAITLFSTYRTPAAGAKFQFYEHAIIALAFLTFGCLSNPGERKTIFRTILTLGVAESLYAAFEAFAKPPLLWATAVPGAARGDNLRLQNEIVGNLERSQGSLGHPLLLAFLLLVALAIALRNYNGPRKRLIVAVLLVGLFFTGSRSAAVVAILLFLLATKNRATTLIGGFFATVIVAGLVTGIIQSSVVSGLVTGGSATHRQAALASVPRLINQQTFEPLMIGNGWYSVPGAFARGLLQNDGFFAIDNQFVAVIVTGGLLSLLIWLAIMAVTVFRSGPDLRPAASAAFAMFWVFDVFEFPSTWALLVLLVGMSAAKTPDTPVSCPVDRTAVLAGARL